MYKNHRDILGVQGSEAHNFNVDQSTFLCGFEECDEEPQTVLYSEKRQSALFLLKTLIASKISDSALDTLIGDISILLERKIDQLTDNLTGVLDQKGIQFDSDISSVFKDHQITAPFHGLHTEYQRRKYYEEEMNCLVR